MHDLHDSLCAVNGSGQQRSIKLFTGSPAKCLSWRVVVQCIFLSLLSLHVSAQQVAAGDSTEHLTVTQCIAYALKHQPSINQAYFGISIARATNGINVAGWFPQVYVNGNAGHYLQLPTSYVNNTANPGGPPVKQTNGVTNTFIPELSVTQALFSPALLYAAKAAPLYVKQAQQITDSAKINIVAAVTKSFYSLLLTLEQINVLKEDTVRLSQNLADSYHQYVGGIVDETDYEQATITLNNSKAQLRQSNENVIPQYANLKQLMGYPPAKQFNVDFDTLAMKNDIAFDTTQQLQYEKRIELQQLATTRSLQQLTTSYYRHAFLPTVSAFYDYNYEFENNHYANLFSSSFPNSLIGLTFSVPVFTGFSRLKYLQRSRLQEQLINWDEVTVRSTIYSEYTSAMANYRGNRYNLQVLQENVALAKRVYFVVTLQYKQGLVAYLNVINAESNLISSEISYINALFQVLSNKVDLEKAMGLVSY